MQKLYVVRPTGSNVDWEQWSEIVWGVGDSKSVGEALQFRVSPHLMDVMTSWRDVGGDWGEEVYRGTSMSYNLHYEQLEALGIAYNIYLE